MSEHIENFYAGTSGLILPVANKSFYPKAYQDKSRLHYYSSLVNTIEINSSFYKIPMPSTVEKWAADVPDNFKFSFKLFREITHLKGLVFDGAVLNKFFDSISKIGNRMGCLLLQFPPSIHITDYPQLQLLVSILRERNLEGDLKIALEFRHSSLYVDKIYNFLEDFGLGMVIHDKKPAQTPIINTEVDFKYLRFHGPNGNYRESYEDDVLFDYATYIAEWLTDGKEVFVYFNNTMGAAHDNLVTLRQFVSDKIATKS